MHIYIYIKIYITYMLNAFKQFVITSTDSPPVLDLTVPYLNTYLLVVCLFVTDKRQNRQTEGPHMI